MCRKLGYLVPMSLEFPSHRQEDKELIYLDEQEEQRLLKELSIDRETHSATKAKNVSKLRLSQFQDQQDFVVALLDLGARTQEVARIEWQNLDLERRTVTYRMWKVSRTQTKDLTDRLIDVLTRRCLERREGQKYVFENPDKTDHRAYNIAWLIRAAERAGIEKHIGFHSLRKSYASKLVQNGVELMEVQQLLGHKRITTTAIYAQLAPSQASKKAASVLNRITGK